MAGAEVGWLKCRVGLQSTLVQASLFTKGVRNCSHEVFANQYWKCSHACRSVLEVLSVKHACRSWPMVIDLVSPSTAWERVQKTNHTFFFSISIKNHVKC